MIGMADYISWSLQAENKQAGSCAEILPMKVSMVVAEMLKLFIFQSVKIMQSFLFRSFLRRQWKKFIILHILEKGLLDKQDSLLLVLDES